MAGEDNASHISSVLDGGLWDVVTGGQGKHSVTRAAVERTEAHMQRQVAALQAMGPQAHTAASGSGGGYHFDPETIAQRIRDWEQVLDDINADELELRGAQNKIVAPSPDKPAAENAKATALSIQAAIDHNDSMRKYAQSWLDALRKANGTYVETDQDTGKGLSSAESATDGHGLLS